MVPALGCSRSAMTRSKVVLPQPDGPMKETNSPAAICRSILDSASTWPSDVSKVRDTPFASTASAGRSAGRLVSVPELMGVCIDLVARTSPFGADLRAVRSAGGCILGAPSWHKMNHCEILAECLGEFAPNVCSGEIKMCEPICLDVAVDRMLALEFRASGEGACPMRAPVGSFDSGACSFSYLKP